MTNMTQQANMQRADRLKSTMARIRLDVQYGREEFWRYETDCRFNNVIELSHRAVRICSKLDFLQHQLSAHVSPTEAADFVAVAGPIVKRSIALWRKIADACEDQGLAGADRAREIAATMAATLRDIMPREGSTQG